MQILAFFFRMGFNLIVHEKNKFLIKYLHSIT